MWFFKKTSTIKDKKSEDLIDFNGELNKVFKGLDSLFTPFKELVLKILPSLAILFIIIEKTSKLIALILRYLAKLLNLLARTTKTALFRYTSFSIIIVVLVVYGLFFIISKNANSESNKKQLIDTIASTYNYNLTLGGDIDIRPFPYPRIVLRNVVLQPITKSNDISVAKIEIKNLILTGSWISLLKGDFSINNFKAENSVISLSTGYSEAIDLSVSDETLESVLNQYIKQNQEKQVNSVINNTNNKFSSSISWYFNNIYFDLTKFSLLNSSVSVVDSTLNEVTLLKNIDLLVNKDKSNYNILGSYVLNDNEYEYNAKLTKNSDNGVIEMNLARNSSDLIKNPVKIVAKYSNFPALKIEGELTLKNQDAMNLLDWFLDINNKNKSEASNYEANLSFKLEKQVLNIPQFKITLAGNKILGSGDIILSSERRPVIIRISEISPDFWNMFKDSSLDFSNQNREKIVNAVSDIFASKFKEINNILSSEVVLFSSNIANLDKKLDFSVILKQNYATINNLEYESKLGNRIKLSGKLDIPSSTITGLFNLKASAPNEIFKTNESLLRISDSFLKNKPSEVSGFFSGKSNTINLTNVTGNIGLQKIFGSSIIFTFDSQNTNLSASINTDKLLIDAETTKVLESYITSFMDNYKASNKFLGIEPSQNIDFNIKSGVISYKSMLFKNADFSLKLLASGVQLSKFTAQGMNSGTIDGTVSLDMASNPYIFGNLTLSNLSINAKDLRNFMFKDYTLSSNLVIDGNLKFSGNSFVLAMQNSFGSFNLQSQSRVIGRTSANIPGLHIGLIRRGKNAFILNDLVGNLSITNGIINIYPGTLTLENFPADYRGGLSGTIDIAKKEFNLETQLQNLKSGKPAGYSIKGIMLSPQYFRTQTTKSTTFDYKQPSITNRNQVSPKENVAY